MVKDYAKKYRKLEYPMSRRKNNAILWGMLGISVGLLIIGLLFFLKSAPKEKSIQPIEKKRKEIIQTPTPKPPEPQFDFYNILPHENLNLSQQGDSVMQEMPFSRSTSITSLESRSIDAMMSTTPEQVAIAEAKKQLEEEMGRLNNKPYILVLGNFTDRIHAEQLQAQALLKGIPVRKKVIWINGKPTYQIMMGPVDLNQLSNEKKRLNAAGLSAIVVKISS
ncbi:conserved hypothetical protein [Rickettsiella grylli]|uniref:SPOR domain-containing protein n=2 Tax=Rickettsiella grylli TaxID=59196 RepID=A8PKU6_9COXI|nr:conserved hypothetical protein [Rickettsiella grylli]